MYVVPGNYLRPQNKKTCGKWVVRTEKRFLHQSKYSFRKHNSNGDIWSAKKKKEWSFCSIKTNEIKNQMDATVRLLDCSKINKNEMTHID